MEIKIKYEEKNIIVVLLYDKIWALRINIKLDYYK